MLKKIVYNIRRRKEYDVNRFRLGVYDRKVLKWTFIMRGVSTL